MTITTRTTAWPTCRVASSSNVQESRTVLSAPCASLSVYTMRLYSRIVEAKFSSQLAAFTQLQCRGYTSAYGRRGPGVEKTLCRRNGSVSRFSFFAFVDSFLRNSSVYVSRKEIGESDRKRSKLPFKIGRFDQIKTNGCWCHQRFQLKDGSINVGTADDFRGKNERRVGLPASHL